MKLPSIGGVFRAALFGAMLASVAIAGVSVAQTRTTVAHSTSLRQDEPSHLDLMAKWGHVDKIWFVYTQGGAEHRAWKGTAFILKGVGIITAGHVIDAGLRASKDAKIEFRGEELRLVASKSEYDKDLAILVPANKDSKLLTAGLELSDTEPCPDSKTKVWAMGFPANSAAITEGFIKGLSHGLVCAGYYSNGGISGGPILARLDRDLRVVGVSVRGYAVDGVRLPDSLFVKLSVLREFIKEASALKDKR